MKNKIRNKRGIATGYIFFIIVFALVFVLTYGIIVYGMNQANNALMSEDFMAGSVNFTNATASTFGIFVTGLNNSANLIGAGVMFAMFLAMLINAFLSRGRDMKIFIIVDIIILVVSVMLAAYLSNAYETIIGINELSSTFANTMNVASTFMLKLPLFVIVFGILILIVSYAGIPRTREEEVAGF